MDNNTKMTAREISEKLLIHIQTVYVRIRKTGAKPKYEKGLMTFSGEDLEKILAFPRRGRPKVK